MIKKNSQLEISKVYDIGLQRYRNLKSISTPCIVCISSSSTPCTVYISSSSTASIVCISSSSTPCSLYISSSKPCIVYISSSSKPLLTQIRNIRKAILPTQMPLTIFKTCESISASPPTCHPRSFVPPLRPPLYTSQPLSQVLVRRVGLVTALTQGAS